jgi:hypothetical protein
MTKRCVFRNRLYSFGFRIRLQGHNLKEIIPKPYIAYFTATVPLESAWMGQIVVLLNFIYRMLFVLV